MARKEWPEWAQWPMRCLAYRDFVVKNSDATLRGQLWQDRNGKMFVTDDCNNWYDYDAFVK